LSELMRDGYTAATILCNHIGEQNRYFPEGDRAGTKGAWYARQVEATSNFEVSRPLAILCGGLEHQIEHHLFPKVPPERIREAAPQVKAACEAHGVRYNTGRWRPALRKVLSQVRALSRP
jgi:linoleoyl-CoA desaturase